MTRKNSTPIAYVAIVMLRDPEIDAVYIPLPQHLHCEYTIKAACAGKHVLVEKPSALTVADLQKMVAACREHGVLFMEAFMYRFHPQTNALKKLLHEGRVAQQESADPLQARWRLR